MEKQNKFKQDKTTYNKNKAAQLRTNGEKMQ